MIHQDVRVIQPTKQEIIVRAKERHSWEEEEARTKYRQVPVADPGAYVFTGVCLSTGRGRCLCGGGGWGGSTTGHRRSVSRGNPPPPPIQEDLRRHTRYASCSHTRGLSCLTYFYWLGGGGS